MVAVAEVVNGKGTTKTVEWLTIVVVELEEGLGVGCVARVQSILLEELHILILLWLEPVEPVECPLLEVRIAHFLGIVVGRRYDGIDDQRGKGLPSNACSLPLQSPPKVEVCLPIRARSQSECLLYHRLI